jgi:tryptophan synthase beta subunit
MDSKNNFNQSLEETVEVMNTAFTESQRDDEFSEDFLRLFEKAAKKVEKLMRIKQLAEGHNVSI